MEIRFLLGPAGSGKTYRCIQEVRRHLMTAPEAPPLLFLTPKQATFQLERRLLVGQEANIPAGYTRLQILSLDRLAHLLLNELQGDFPGLLDEEGRLMVLRALLTEKKDHLQVFRSSARMPGFAQQLSDQLRELQCHQVTPRHLLRVSEELAETSSLGLKLRDLAILWQAYLDWLAERNLLDSGQLIRVATESLKRMDATQGTRWFQAEGLWLDGFAELTPEELEFLALFLPHTNHATLAFCLESAATDEMEEGWLSPWSMVGQTFRNCVQRFSILESVEIHFDLLSNQAEGSGRFGDNLPLHHLERNWSNPTPFAGPRLPSNPPILRLVETPDIETEIRSMAHDILDWVRAGHGRFRDAAILLRQWNGYHDVIRRVLTQFEIPFFMDRREPIAHHPLTELTRSALRVIAHAWRNEDWFALLKTGLFPLEDEKIDQLENEALARGWTGNFWQRPISLPNQAALAQQLETTRQIVMAPMNRLIYEMGDPEHLTGLRLASSLLNFWDSLSIQDRLNEWSARNLTLGMNSAIHATVWQQIEEWLENFLLAFDTKSMPLREWLPILEAGLGGLTVGVIPPALDQVLIGTLDRSRNPELKLAYVMGLNEGAFPKSPTVGGVLSERERKLLESHRIQLGPRLRSQMGAERYFAYIAFTRASQRLVLSYSRRDVMNKGLNPSLFVGHFRRLFPSLEVETVSGHEDWTHARHPHELMAPILSNWQRDPDEQNPELFPVQTWPSITLRLDPIRWFRPIPLNETLSPALAERLYGKDLETSVSRLEQFAACPFRFFLNSGLALRERKVFEVGVREQGQFQHEVLQLFHETLKHEGKQWRDCGIQEARNRIREIADNLARNFSDGLLWADAQRQFTASMMAESLQDFVQTLIEWMARYQFDPHVAELAFGGPTPQIPAWRLDLDGEKGLIFRGVIDRVDLHPLDEKTALFVVIDYKSSAKRIDPILAHNGIQLQLPAYLNVLRQTRNHEQALKYSTLHPVGVFYVNLNGTYPSGKNRNEVLSDESCDRRLAYQHSGRFDASFLTKLDHHQGGTSSGQFRYSLKKDGELSKRGGDAMDPASFNQAMDQIEQLLKSMGNAIFRGEVSVAPYRFKTKSACDHCDYASICRIDFWTHPYRSLETPNDG